MGLPITATIAPSTKAVIPPPAGPVASLRMTGEAAGKWLDDWHERRRLLEEACVGMTPRGWGAMMRQRPQTRERLGRRERRQEAREQLMAIGRA